MATPEVRKDKETKERFLAGKIVLITGSTRGIGRQIALSLAESGADIIVNYRDPQKERRAKRTESEVRAKGVTTYLVRADITSEEDRLVRKAEELGGLDVLVLNAAGGLGPGVRQDKARRLNVEAQIDLVEKLWPLINPGGIIIYITSHWAHRFEDESYETPSWYEVVARTKHECEQILNKMIDGFERKGVKLLILSGALTKETSAHLLLERQARKDPELMARLKRESIEIKRWGEVLLKTLKSGFQSGDVVFVDKGPS